jgi:hypothetical protein
MGWEERDSCERKLERSWWYCGRPIPRPCRKRIGFEGVEDWGRRRAYLYCRHLVNLGNKISL